MYPTVPSVVIDHHRQVDMAAARGAYIDQSQSFNVFMTDANFGKLTSMHFYAWKKGLKTGMYYLRTKAAAQAIQFTVDQASLKSGAAASASAAGGTAAAPAGKNQADMVCSLTNKDECLSCGA